jgi:hypothetical protein
MLSSTLLTRLTTHGKQPVSFAFLSFAARSRALEQFPLTTVIDDTTGKETGNLCDYQDACKTYALFVSISLKIRNFVRADPYWMRQTVPGPFENLLKRINESTRRSQKRRSRINRILQW